MAKSKADYTPEEWADRKRKRRLADLSGLIGGLGHDLEDAETEEWAARDRAENIRIIIAEHKAEDSEAGRRDDPCLRSKESPHLN